MITIRSIKVLVVDDSALVRKIIVQELSKDPEIDVVDTANDPYSARDKITEYHPDVILLDIEMPKMDGLTFLKKLMQHYPLRVIVVSSVAGRGSDNALRALEYGALDVIEKPGYSLSIGQMGEELIKKIKEVAEIPLHKLGVRDNLIVSPQEQVNKKAIKINKKSSIIAIGSSTGGVEAITEILTAMPENAPPIMIVQHMPPNFTKSFANRLNSICRIEVKEAEEMEILTPGKAVIAPGNMHIELKKKGYLYFVKYKDVPPVNFQKPAVDILFDSVAENAGDKSIGVILTGMGRDGAEGLLKMKNSGAFTIAQDEESSIVFGMPKEAIKLGAADKVVPLKEITREVLEYLGKI